MTCPHCGNDTAHPPVAITWDELLTAWAQGSGSYGAACVEDGLWIVCDLTNDDSRNAFHKKIDTLYAQCSDWAKANPTCEDWGHSDDAEMQHVVMAEIEYRLAEMNPHTRAVLQAAGLPDSEIDETQEWMQENGRMS